MFEVIKLFQGVSYAYNEGPHRQDLSCFDNEFLQLNCQLLAHLVLEEMGLALPKFLRSLELYRRSSAGKVWVEKVQPNDARIGDIYLFSNRPILSIHDPILKYLHIAICVDRNPVQLIHAHRWQKNGRLTKMHQGVSIWSVTDFCESTKYNTLVGVRRVIQ